MTDLPTIAFRNKWNMEFVEIQPGSFMMGKKIVTADYFADNPLHPVTLTRPYLIQTTPVTQAQWLALMGNNPSKHPDDLQKPVNTVSWNDAHSMIRVMNEKSGLSEADAYRLPTEAEWEYAARAGSSGDFYFGQDVKELENHAWYDMNSRKQSHAVAQKRPNPWGLYDLYGNVWEWVQDINGDFPLYAQTDPTGPLKGPHRVERGGCSTLGSYACNSHRRGRCSPSKRSTFTGFRLVKSLPVKG